MNNQVDTLIINGFSNPAALKRWSSTAESFAAVLNYDEPRCPYTLAAVDLHDEDLTCQF